MTVDEQIQELDTTGTVVMSFQNVRAEIFFKALKMDYMVIIAGVPFYVNEVTYHNFQDQLTFDIERVLLPVESDAARPQGGPSPSD